MFPYYDEIMVCVGVSLVDLPFRSIEWRFIKWIWFQCVPFNWFGCNFFCGY